MATFSYYRGDPVNADHLFVEHDGHTLFFYSDRGSRSGMSGCRLDGQLVSEAEGQAFMEAVRDAGTPMVNDLVSANMPVSWPPSKRRWFRR